MINRIVDRFRSEKTLQSEMNRASRSYRAFSVLALVGACSLACSGETADSNVPGSGLGPSGQAGGGPGQAGSSSVPGGGGGTNTPTPGGGGGSAVGGNSGGGPVELSMGGPKLRVLTQSEYTNSLTYLLGAIKAPLTLPADTFVAGFTGVGAGQVTINASAVELYETASRAAAAEVFADAPRWQELVGCQPKADLSDACVTTFIKAFGKRAFRRDLTEGEVQQWLTIGKEAAQLSTTAAQGLSTVVSGLMQSPYFLYRVETNKLDAASQRLKYDGASMATRLAFFLTGRSPSDALLSAAASGQLDTAEGVRMAAAPLLADSRAAERMALFFSEFSQAHLVTVSQKSAEMFPSFTPALQASMLQATQLFIKNVVLGPGADVRSFFDSDQTFVDATLAPIYGVSAPASGFAQIKLGAETGRAGILGQAAVITAHSQPDRSSPTRRGVFVAENFLCRHPPPPPDGVPTELTFDPTLTTRQTLELHREDTKCAGCHTLFDPYGMALEHFDAIGRYRATEGGLAIDATGTLDGTAFNGAAELGAALRGNAAAMSCMISHFYRNANGVVSSEEDAEQLAALAETLASKKYVWRDLVTEFVSSDAFRSAPAAVVTTSAGNQ